MATPAGLGVVMVQDRAHVTVLVNGRLVVVYQRWEVTPVASVEYTEEDLAWFRRPASEVVS